MRLTRCSLLATEFLRTAASRKMTPNNKTKQSELLSWTSETRLTIALLGFSDAKQRGEFSKQPHRLVIFDDSPTLLAYCESCGVDAVVLGMSKNGHEPDVVRALLRELSDPMRYACPVFLCAPCLSETCIAEAIELGASDFLFPPLDCTELIARVRASQHKAPLKTSHIQTYSPYSFDIASHQLYINETPVSLTTREFSLALYFFHHAGKLILRKRILSDIWGISTHLDTRRVDTYISRIRSKLRLNADDSAWRLNSVYQKGYILERREPVPNTPKP